MIEVRLAQTSGVRGYLKIPLDVNEFLYPRLMARRDRAGGRGDDVRRIMGDEGKSRDVITCSDSVMGD